MHTHVHTLFTHTLSSQSIGWSREQTAERRYYTHGHTPAAGVSLKICIYTSVWLTGWYTLCCSVARQSQCALNLRAEHAVLLPLFLARLVCPPLFIMWTESALERWPALQCTSHLWIAETWFPRGCCLHDQYRLTQIMSSGENAAEGWPGREKKCHVSVWC